MIPILFFMVWGIGQILGADGIELSLPLFFGGFFGYFLFWLYTINYGLELLNIELEIPNKLNKNKRLMLAIIITFLTAIILSLPIFNLKDSILIVGINTVFGLVGFFVLIYLFYNITEDYIFHAKNRMPRLVDYFIVLFHFAFFPIGLVLLHSHVRLMMKDKNIIEKE